MPKTIRKFAVLLATLFVLAGAMVGCAKSGMDKTEGSTDSVTNEIEMPNENSTAPENSAPPVSSGMISYRFADAEEGIALRMENEHYFENLTQNDLDYRTGKRGATLEDFKELAQQQGDTFTDEEKHVIAESITRIEARFKEIGFHYPANSDIIFVKNKMSDEFGAVAYTQSNQIYLEGENLDFMKDIPGLLDGMIVHELFHVLSRKQPRSATGAL